MKILINLLFFTGTNFFYAYLANLENNPRIYFMVPFQFLLGLICFFIKPTWKSGLGMILGVVIFYGIFIWLVVNDYEDPIELIETIIPAVQ